ncbi:hypothetical protein PIB30_089384, partial [Stylosanthes scabra]|nr:hypothetical protein [Stylosanthes scabra]
MNTPPERRRQLTLGSSSPPPHQLDIFHALVQSTLQAWILFATLEDEDFDERRGQKLRDSRKLPPLVTYESQDMQGNNYSDCAICMENFQDGQSCQIFPECKHMFHSDCMD